MQIDLTQIILAIITLIGAFLTKYLVPLIKKKILSEDNKLSDNQRMLIKLAIQTAVTAAEQIYKSEEGEQKKAYVLALLKSQGFDVDTSAIDAEIEAAVLNLHQQLKTGE